MLLLVLIWEGAMKVEDIEIPVVNPWIAVEL
jgi:hypothetical protein